MNNINLSFTGEYEYSLDQKNRLIIPAKFRKSLAPINNKIFVLTKGLDNCLILYPLNEWNNVEKQLGQLSTIKEKNRNFIRNVVRYATYLKYDNQGRIAIPAPLLSHSKIEKEEEQRRVNKYNNLMEDENEAWLRSQFPKGGENN